MEVTPAQRIGLQNGALRSLSTWFRKKRDRKLRDQVDRLYAQFGAVRILDMGGSVDYWQRVGFDYLRSRKCHVSVLNIRATELGRAAPADIMEAAVGDATNLSQYEDGEFHLAHSNSVIEHLRTWSAMRSFAAETRRVGKAYYVQTPNFWFPIDPHYYRFPLFHWLPRPLRSWLFYHLPVAQGGRMPSWNRAFEVVDASRLLVRRQMAVLFPDARHSAERVACLPKSLIAQRDA